MAVVQRTARPVMPQVWRRYAVPTGIALAALVLIVVTGGKGTKLAEVPTWLDAHVKPRVDVINKWAVKNNQKHWIFTGVFDPIASALKGINSAVYWILRTLRWPGVLGLTAAIGWKTGGRRAALVGVLTMAACGVLGFWNDTMVSLSLMIVAVFVSLLIGLPLGIWAGLNDRANRWLRTFLDTAQVMPAYVYLLPIVVLFGIGNAGAVVATVIFAVAPAVRLTSHGLRNVPIVATEVGTSFGCTPKQLLRKVQLPMARRSMLLGLNQVIMMAFGILVIAAYVGAGGLGALVLHGLQNVDVGKAFAPGLAMVFAAVALDRITTGERRRAIHTSPLGIRLQKILPTSLARIAAALAAVVVLAVLAKMLGASTFPKPLQVSISKPINVVVKWVNNHVRKGVPVIGGTGAINDFLVLKLLTPLRVHRLVACGAASRRGGLEERRSPTRRALCGVHGRNRGVTHLGSGHGHAQPGAGGRRYLGTARGSDRHSCRPI
jgi:glycine betaine/proline transport system permease protein